MEFDLLYMEPRRKEHTSSTQDLVRDLKLDLLFDVMAGGDDGVKEACRAVLMHPLATQEGILARRAVLEDAVNYAALFESLYQIAWCALEKAKKHAEFLKPKYDKVVSCSNKIVTETEIACIWLAALKACKAAFGKHRDIFQSEGMQRLCTELSDAVTDNYLARVDQHLMELGALKTANTVLLSSHIGEGLKMADVRLNSYTSGEKPNRLPYKNRSIVIPLASITLIQNAEEITEKSLAPMLKTVASFNRGVQRFFEKLCFPLRFYVGCIRLHRRLKELGIPVCYPQIVSSDQQYEARSLIDAGLAVKESALPVGNDVSLSGKRLVLITGPNQGGKTTFLRSIGLAQVMAQCGLFVTASSFTCPLFSGICTHFPNGEDASMQMGLLEVELSKLSGLMDVLKPGALLLMNESFQTTTPSDAKRLALEVTKALRDANVTLFFVTHLYGYAMEVYTQKAEDTQFLLAQRSREGKNTYCVGEGAPYKTAFGMTLLSEVMGN